MLWSLQLTETILKTKVLLTLVEGEPVFAEHRHWAARPTLRLSSLDALAWKESWHFNSVIQKRENRPGEFTWTPLDEGSTIRYCESAIIKARYVYASGRDSAEIFRKLGALEVYRADELVDLAHAEKDPAERALHVLKLGLAATPRGVLANEGLQPEPKVVAFLGKMLKDPAPELRDAAITATNFLKWEDLLDGLDAVAENDDVEDNRILARRAAREIRHYIATFSPAP